MKQELEVYARFKPKSSQFQISTKVIQNKQVIIQLDKNQRTKSINNIQQSLQFNFNQIFNQNQSQEEIFQIIGLPVIKNCLEGYNGTIFAYGQTGSGKTHTISGGESWSQRGIIPRVLSEIFDEFEHRKDQMKYQMYISFMEIYNENAYDLLDKYHLENQIEQWSKIILKEDDSGHLHLKNLSVHQVNNEQQGIDLLMMGNFIRQVSSTPMNQCSSRSHCIFTITIEGTSLVNEFGFIAKLHLVDLAGSERIGKTQVEGSLLNEAKYINLSLTYLEQVIIALQERAQGNRTHIPYRNSLLTTILKDSLGGNCRTSMIATLSSDLENLEETISTARFAQRCAQLENEISKNQKIDLQMLVQRLEIENKVLLNELQAYKNNQNNNQIDIIYTHNKNPNDFNNTNYQQDEVIKKQVENFLNDNQDQIDFNTQEEAHIIFKTMKELYNTRMKEYVTELTFISEKLQKYDEILTKKKYDYSINDSSIFQQENTNLVAEQQQAQNSKILKKKQSAQIDYLKNMDRDISDKSRKIPKSNTFNHIKQIKDSNDSQKLSQNSNENNQEFISAYQFFKPKSLQKNQ